MKSFIKKFFDKSLLLFLIIGACNTVLSLASNSLCLTGLISAIGVPLPQLSLFAASAAFISIKNIPSKIQKRFGLPLYALRW